MLKIFSTQLTGYLKRIAEQEDESLEDGARLLAQALTGSGTIYMYGTREMEGVVAEALYGEEPFRGAQRLEPGADIQPGVDIQPADRILLVSRFSTDEDIVALAKQLQEDGHSIVGMSAVKEGAPSLVDYVDVHIDTKLTKALIPNEDGTRSGFPSLMTSLFAYYGLRFIIEEILAEYDEDLGELV
ncbi:DUF2529 domain-containing protein [Ectobacillus ponti]|uniref:DUF2529 domain-containing protein n=1 Tax=Ectobacillus ponti TaxID=2961894 RepID=A0AA41X7V5_9BACI|nr:DUF2529 domain-containing protein [Ectobacillus ponti]MCP8967950.1 DUF2529 domain-containing protein [Ectobacillus ponti]